MFAKLANARRHATTTIPAGEERETDPPENTDMIQIALPSSHVARFAAALAATLDGAAGGPVAKGAGTEAPTPAGLEQLVESAVTRAGGVGTARVMRSPAGLYSPEYWRVALTDADPRGVEVVTLAARGAPPPA